MTDRINAYLVVLNENVRTDDAAQIETALSMVKGVLSVKPNVADWASCIASERAHQTLRGKLMKVLYPEDAT